MKNVISKRRLAIIAAGSLIAFTGLAATGCSSEDNTQSSDDNTSSSQQSSSPTIQTSSTGTVAATVNGHDISEESVANSIESIRKQYGAEDDAAFAAFLRANSLTPDKMREQIINDRAERMVLVEGAKNDLGLSVGSGEIDEKVSQDKTAAGESWEQHMAEAGCADEDQYRSYVEITLLVEKLKDYFTKQAGTDEQAASEQASEVAENKVAKRSQAIFFGVVDSNTGQANITDEDRNLARDVCGQIKSGTLTFEDAVQQYSQEEFSKSVGGDMGWDSINDYPTKYAEAVKSLNQGDISDPVDTELGCAIIRVTETYTFPDDPAAHIDEMPQEIATHIKDNSENVAEQAFSEWMTKQMDAADIKINDIPQDAKYNINMDEYPEAESEVSTSIPEENPNSDIPQQENKLPDGVDNNTQ